MKRWLISVAGVIAAAAVVVGNLDGILSAGAKWLGPYIVPYLSAHADLSVVPDADLALAADVFVADPANQTHAIAVGRAQKGQKAVLHVPANVLYTIGWQGAGLEAGAASNILAVPGETSFRLIHAGESQGQIKVSLRQSDADRAAPPATEPSAKLLLSARVAQGAVDPSVSITAGALPELDRAAAIVGLFETGTTDCARRLFFMPAVMSGPDLEAPSVGCFGASIPGWLADMILAIDAGDTRRLDALLGEKADLLRNYAHDPRAVPQRAPLQQTMERLLAAPEFWINYQEKVLAIYAQAADQARQIGLVSERGRLLVFDRLTNFGPGAVARATRRYAEQYPEGATGRPGSEAERIRALGELLKAEAPRAFAPQTARRIDTIVSGHGSVHGINFDLDQLGVSASG